MAIEKHEREEDERLAAVQGSSPNNAPVVHPGILSALASTSAAVSTQSARKNDARLPPTRSIDSSLKSTSSAELEQPGFLGRFRERWSSLHIGRSRDRQADPVYQTDNSNAQSRQLGPTGRTTTPEQHDRTGASTPTTAQELQLPLADDDPLHFVRVIRLRSFRMHQRRILRRSNEWEATWNEEWIRDTEQGDGFADDGNCLADAQLFQNFGDGVFLHKDTDRQYFLGTYAFMPEEVRSFGNNRTIIDAINKYGTIEIAHGWRELKSDEETNFLRAQLQALCAMFGDVDDEAGILAIKGSAEFGEMQEVFDREYVSLKHKARTERKLQIAKRKACLEYAKVHMHHECSCQMEEHVEEVSAAFKSDRGRPIDDFSAEPRGGLFALLE